MLPYSKPTTRTAWLPRDPTPSEPHPSPSLHVYDGTEEGRDHVDDPVWLHMFKCVDTGARRVWGCEGARPNGTTVAREQDDAQS